VIRSYESPRLPGRRTTARVGVPRRRPSSLSDLGDKVRAVAVGKVGSRRGRKHRRHRQDPNYYTQAGPVTVRGRDGEVVRVEAPVDRETYAKLIKERWPISPKVRIKVFRRDRGRCRYCGGQDNLAVDHVVPVALGGSNRMRNLVVCCEGCNSRKGASVWKPRPLTQPLP
jgi:hypothetical protein